MMIHVFPHRRTAERPPTKDHFRKWESTIPDMWAWYAGRQMGRRATTRGGRLSLDMDPALKLKASIAALRAGISLTELVSRGLVLALAELRDKAREQDDKA